MVVRRSIVEELHPRLLSVLGVFPILFIKINHDTVLVKATKTELIVNLNQSTGFDQTKIGDRVHL